MSETLEFSCPSCHTGLRVPVQLAGVTGPCPHCQASITSPPAPQPRTQPSPPAPEQIQAAPTQAPLPPAVPPSRPSQIDSQEPHRGEYRSSNASSGRGVFLSVVIPTLFLALSAAAIYLILDVMGVIGPKDTAPESPSIDQKSTAQPAEVVDRADSTKPKVKPAAPDPKPSPPIVVPPSPQPPVTPPAEPVSPPASPTPPAEPNVPELSPQDINRPGEVPIDLPDVTLFRPVFVLDSNDSIKKRAASIEAARHILKQFLNAKTYEERKHLITQSVHSESELINSCLSSPFPVSMEPTTESVFERSEERSLEVFFTVPFENPEGELGRLLVVRMVTYDEGEPPLVHIDPFLDLFESSVRTFGRTPAEGTKTFNVIVELSAYCFDDVPRAEGKAKVTFFENIAQQSTPLTTAYLLKESTIFAELKTYAPPGTKIPCTLTLSWDLETDPSKPFLQVARIESANWRL